MRREGRLSTEFQLAHAKPFAPFTVERRRSLAPPLTDEDFAESVKTEDVRTPSAIRPRRRVSLSDLATGRAATSAGERIERSVRLCSTLEKSFC